MPVCRRGLAVVERTLVEVRLADGWTIRAIARALGRSPGMVSDKVARHGVLRGAGRTGAGGLRAQPVPPQAQARGRGRAVRRDGGPVAQWLVAGADRGQAHTHRGRGRGEQQADRAISHAAIHAALHALHALPRGEPRRELIACLRQGLRPRAQAPVHELGGSELCCKLCDMTPIAERPADVAARLVPGRREGDLILGQANSAIGTLVERTTRLLLLVLMPTHKADVAASAFTGALNAIPAPLRRTLTYDQGKEMARHKERAQARGAQARGAQATGMRVFSDPHAPWQPGRNENTNRLLRRCCPKGLSLASLIQADLDTVADSLDTRPHGPGRRSASTRPTNASPSLLTTLPSSTTPDPSVRSGN